jgi:hypothetical protein
VGKEIYDSTQVDYNLKDGIDPFKGNGKLAGRKNIRMTEWGPYDFRYPLIWNTNPTDTSEWMQFELLGPKGKWRIKSLKGVEPFTYQIDSLPTTFKAKKAKGQATDIEITAEYKGAGFTDQFGGQVSASKPYTFTFQKFFQPIDFTVSYYDFDSVKNPIKTAYRETIKHQRPFKIESTNKLDYAWWGGIKVNELQHKQFLLIAEGTTEIAKGNYELSITWDDAVRVYVDGKLFTDEWNPSKYSFDESPNRKVKLRLGGKHTFRVEHVELGGFATLSLKLNKAR